MQQTQQELTSSMNSSSPNMYRYVPNLFLAFFVLSLIADICSVIYLVLLSMANWVELSDLLFFFVVIILQVIIFPRILVSFVSVSKEGLRLRTPFYEIYADWKDITSRETVLGLVLMQPKQPFFSRRIYVLKFLVGYNELADKIGQRKNKRIVDP